MPVDSRLVDWYTHIMKPPKNDPTQPTRLTPISQAATYAEIGEFWDTHSGADFWDQMVEVEMTTDSAARREPRYGHEAGSAESHP